MPLPLLALLFTGATVATTALVATAKGPTVNGDGGSYGEEVAAKEAQAAKDSKCSGKSNSK